MIAIQWKYLFMQLYIHFLRWHGMEVNYSQCCQYRTVLAGTVGIYRIGRQSSTVNPYVSYR